MASPVMELGRPYRSFWCRAGKRLAFYRLACFLLASAGPLGPVSREAL
ncbi:MAG: hypothetical protein VXW32_00275 [Myxococcota bacterium]|nr:hypothetical protein [Myxococcota bacterium]